MGDVIDKIGDAQPVVIRKGNGGLNGITNGDRGAGGRSIKCLCSGSFEPFSKQERLPDEFPGPENQNTFPLVDGDLMAEIGRRCEHPQSAP